MDKDGVLRRTFLQSLALAPAVRGSDVVPGLKVVRGPVNTAVIERRGKTLLIDSGELTAPAADWALYTHHHRDQASQAWRLAARGTRIAVPAAERAVFEDAAGYWQSKDLPLNGRLLKMRPALFSIRESVPVARALADGDVLEWEGLRFEAVATPGHTDGSLSYVAEVEGRRIAFTGDLIYGPGQMWELWSLQKRYPGMAGDYWGFGGAAEELKASLDRLLAKKPDVLVPSHGVIMREPERAVAELKKNLDAVMDNFLTTAAWRFYGGFEKIHPVTQAPPMLPPLPAAATPDWIWHRDTSVGILAADGSVFLSDCGSREAIEELEGMRAAGKIRSVDGLWITHYHSDHNEFIPLARQRFGARLYVQRDMADITEHPLAYPMPCIFPQPIPIDRVLEDGESIAWKEFKLTAYHFPGQTLYHAGLLVERGGFRAFLVGDSFANWGVDDYCSENRCFLGARVGYEKCLELLLKVKPDILVAAHWGVQPVSEGHLRRTLELFQARGPLYRRLLPHDDPNFGLDPYWIRAYPYRQPARPGDRIQLDVCVLNHAPAAKQVRVELRLPEGWKALQDSAGGTVPGRTEGRFRLSAQAPGSVGGGRQVLGIRAEVNGRPLGEFAEAIAEFPA